MASRADEYRRLPQECLELAPTIATRGQNTLMEMARIWTRLADEAARQEIQQRLQSNKDAKK